jgi:hypothetical protein
MWSFWSLLAVVGVVEPILNTVEVLAVLVVCLQGLLV